MNKIKVLVVDDSLLFQEFLLKGINEDPELKVIAVAKDPFEARDAIMKFKPDVMTLDVEMPRMNGIEFLRQLLPQYSLPTIMVSSLNEVVFDALAVGAIDFVTKPTSMNPVSLHDFVREELAPKIKAAANSKVIVHKRKSAPAAQVPVKKIDENTLNRIASKIGSKRVSKPSGKNPIHLIAIGASTGGTEAILTVLSQLKADLPGIVITQHMPPGFTQMYAKRLDSKCALKVKEAETGDLITKGTAIVAPGDKHLTVYKEGNVYKAMCSAGAKVSGHCPSVDILFSSVAETAQKNALGIILTGMGADGATGLSLMHIQGAETIGQDEESCVVYGMPKVAFQNGAVKYQLPLQSIANKIYQIVKESNG